WRGGASGARGPAPPPRPRGEWGGPAAPGAGPPAPAAHPPRGRPPADAHVALDLVALIAGAGAQSLCLDFLRHHKPIGRKIHDIGGDRKVEGGGVYLPRGRGGGIEPRQHVVAAGGRVELGPRRHPPTRHGEEYAPPPAPA